MTPPALAAAYPVERLDLPCHSGPRQQTWGVILHGTRSGRAGNPREYEGTLRWIADPANGAGYNALLDYDGRVAICVPEDSAAWHAGYLNSHYLGLAFAQPTAHDAITPAQLESGARLVAGWARRYGFPVVARSDRDTTWPGGGILEHRGTWQGAAQGKTDVGEPPVFDLAGFVALVARATRAE